MGHYLFRLADVGEGVAEAEIVAHHVKVGDKIKEDQSLVDVMTDKATVEISSPVQGIVTAVHGEVGAMMPVGSVLVEIDVDGQGNAVEDIKPALPPVQEKAPAHTEAAPQKQTEPAVSATSPAQGDHRYFFRLPDVGEGVAEAEIVAWHVKVGDKIAEDQSLVDVMTDKATVEMTSPVEGVVVAIHGAVGSMSSVGSVLAELAVGAAKQASPAPGLKPAEVVKAEATTPKPAAAPQALTPASKAPAAKRKTVASFIPRAENDAPLAAPATRARAYELGIPLQFVPGTGPGGRITPEDLDAYIASGGLTPAEIGDSRYIAKEGIDDTRVIGLRRKIAEKMQDSKRRIPHFAYVEECDLTELEALRVDLNANRSEAQPKLTLLPFLMRAMVRILPDFPQINARYDDDAGVLHKFEGVHIGIATQTPGGLLVPVVRHAETRDLWDCATELGRVTAAARKGNATREELSGSTITLTSLGPLGGIAATPVINHPEVAIIGPNKLIDRVVLHEGHVTVRKMMNLSSSFDHRIVDGYDAALFIQRLKRLIEHPALIFMD